MSTATALLGLLKAVDADDSEAYLKTNLAGSLDTLDNAVLLASVQTLTNKTLTSPVLTSPTISSGNLTFGTTAQRIQGDFSNATVSNRLMLQSSTTNGNTNIGILPNGSSTTSALRLFNTNDADNAGFVQVTSAGTFSTGTTGTGTAPTAFTFTLTAGNSFAIADTTAAATTPLAALSGTDTITGGVTEALTGGLRLAPTINAATALTVTRHNYITLNNPVLGGAGPAAITDSCVFRFDAAAGTHKAVDSGSTKTSPGTVTQWIKVNVNGTIAYIPSYSSKTS